MILKKGLISLQRYDHVRKIQQLNCSLAADMTSTLAEKYSSLSLCDCLKLEEKPHRSGLLGSPLIDLPLLDNEQGSFAVPPGVEVGSI